MEKYDILIKNCQVLNPDMTVSSTCSVGIKDSWIKKIGPTDELMADSSASEIIDGKGKLVMPGMVDGHTHTCQQLLRGRVADEYPMVWTVSWFLLKVISSQKILISAAFWHVWK